jgi:hypothetical protein
MSYGNAGTSESRPPNIFMFVELRISEASVRFQIGVRSEFAEESAIGP